MKFIIIIFLLFQINTLSLELVDIKGNKIIIEKKNKVFIFMNNFNCKDCISKLTDYFEKEIVDKNSIFYIIETSSSAYSKLNLKKLIETQTKYYNSILFNPNDVRLKDTTNSYFQKFVINNYTPAILIQSDTNRYFDYSKIFDTNGKVIFKFDFRTF